MLCNIISNENLLIKLNIFSFYFVNQMHTNETKENLKMDSVFESIKPFGRFQKINTIILGTIAFVSSLHFYVQIFNMAEPKFSCEPVEKNMNITDVDRCEAWKNSSGSKAAYKCEFRDSYYNLTAVNTWGLVCDKHILIFQSQTIFFVGSICIFLNGFITDRFGRKRVGAVFLIVISIFNLIYQVVVVDMSNMNFLASYLDLDAHVKFILYCVYQFFAGFFVYSLYASAYVIAVEFTTDDYHTLVANMILICFIFGEILLLIVFYFTRNWIPTNWFITASTISLSITYICLVPESPRYLNNNFIKTRRRNYFRS